MTVLTAALEKEVRFEASIEDVWDVLGVPEESSKYIPDFEELEALGDGRYRFRFKPIGFKSVSIEPQYVAQFEMDVPNRVAWTAEPGGTVQQSGEWVLEADGDGTRGTLKVKAEADLPVPKLLKGAAKPFFQETFRKTIDTWVADAKAAIEAS